jgi:hypothetical protein
VILLNNIRKSGKIMGNHVKMNENNAESVIREMRIELSDLYRRLDRLECKWDALMRRLEGVARHPEDEGWFD